MRIYSMTATFGKLNHETLTLKPGLNIIEAPNEWGKSTWCAFLVAMLYGIDSRVHSSTKAGLADKTRFEPWSGQPMSGRIELCWNGRDITIERTGTKRSQFRQFRAFETATGLPVPELTAENCGQMLLGVEKEVFQRAGFIRLTDMPVTQNEALRRRLNALVTTGDESGAAEALSAKLAKLKNTCYANSKTGLLPRAETECKELEASLGRLRQLRKHQQQLQTRQQELRSYLVKLHRHRETLRYQASLQNRQRLSAAQAQEAAARTALADLETASRALPAREDARQRLGELEELQTRQQALYLETQMQPGLPSPPKSPVANASPEPEILEEKLRKDLRRHQLAKHQLAKKAFPLWLLGILLMAAGGGLSFLWLIPGLAVGCIGAAIAITGLTLHLRQRHRKRALQAQLTALGREYGSDDPGQWQEAIAAYRADYESYQRDRTQNEQTLDTLHQQREEWTLAIRALCGDQAPEAFAAGLRQAIALWDALGDARREYQRATGYAQSLQAVTVPLPVPVERDDLTHSEADTDALISDQEARLQELQQELGRCLGQMDSLGQEADLSARLAAAQDRVSKLQHTLSAITLAQSTLVSATSQLQSRFAPRISHRAKELFGKLTGGRYDRLSLAEDLSLLVGTQDEDTLHSSLWRSDGTVDQLYLALRLAVSEELTPSAPLVLDDALVRFDDIRLKAALEILAEESQRKQVLLFTCQSRESKALS